MTETHATTEHAALYHCFNHVTLPRRSPALTGLDTDSQPVWLGSGWGGVGVLEATREPQPHLGSAFTGSGTLAEPRKHRPLHHAALWLLGRALCDTKHFLHGLSFLTLSWSIKALPFTSSLR